MSCPNKNLQDWEDLVNKFGEDGAYYVYMKNGEKIPYLQGRESNRFIWNVENELGLISWKNDNGKNTKKYKGFDRNTAAKVVESIRDNYVGNYIIKHIAPDTSGEYGLKIEGYPISKAEVEAFAEEVGKDFEDSIADYKAYKEFEERENDANEDVIPLEYYDQRDILYDNSVFEETQKEIFNQEQIEELETILLATMPQVKEVVKDRKLEVKGRLEPNAVIKVNPDTMTKDTIGHEFGHLLIDLRGGLSDPFIQQGISQLEGSEFAKKIRETYSDVSEEQIQKEILAQAIGVEVADIFEIENQMNSFEKWLVRLFRWLGARTGISKNNARKLASDLLANKPIDSSKYTGKQSTISQDQIEYGDITDEEDVRILEQPNATEQDKTSELEDNLLDEYDKIREKALTLVRTRISKAKSAGRPEELNDLEELVSKLEDEDNRSANAILQFSKNASEFIGMEYSIYEAAKEKFNSTDEGAVTIKMLNRWHDVLSAYDILDSVVVLLTDKDFLGTDAKLEGKILNRLKISLQDTIAKKNELKEQYKTIGENLLIDNLNRYSGRVKIIKKEEKRKEWRTNNKNHGLSRVDAKKAEDDYAEQYIKENINELSKQTTAMLKSEMHRASEDISTIRMWLDNMQDTNDMVMAAAVKMIVVQDGKSRDVNIKFKNTAWPIVQELYKEAGYKYGFSNVADVYDFMLEKDNKGNRTGHIINNFTSDLIKAKEAYKLSKAHLPFKEANKLNSIWWNENNPLNKTARDKALLAYMRELVESKSLKESDIQAYYENEMKPYEYRPRLREVVDKSSIEGANLIDRWKIENDKRFRTPIDKWKNNDWPAFEKFLNENPDSAKAKFYNLIQENLDYVNKQLPHDKKKYDQLPYIMKDTVERKTNGEKIKGMSKDAFKDLVERRVDEIDRGEYSDESGRPIDYLPFNYNRPKSTHEHIVSYKLLKSKEKIELNNKRKADFKTYKRVIKADTVEEAIEKIKNSVVGIDNASIKVKLSDSIAWSDKDQSYDLMGLYFNYFSMANRYNLMNEVLPEVELTKRITENRDYTQKDHSGNVIMKKLGVKSDTPTTRKGIESNLVKMFDSFIKSSMYGQGKVEEGSWDVMGWKFDKAKMRDNLGTYAAYNMLGLNLIQGVANVGVGELQQVIESIAGEFLTVKDLHKATVNYAKESPSMMGDVGQVVGESKVTHLNEKWDILNEYEGGKFKANSKFARLMRTSTLFFMSNMGEHFMQSRIMIAMLGRKEALDANGEVLGSMYDMYKVKDGHLVLDERVDLVKSGWDEEQQILFGAKVKKLLGRLHGEYSDLGKNAAQRYSIGRMGMMFRKFIVPGYKKRWEGKKVNEFLEEYTEGSYRQMFSFVGRALKETQALGLASFSENWKELSSRERSNMIRGVSELGFGLLLSAMAGAFMTLKGDADDDKERWAYATAAYLLTRVKSEMFFFLNPAETLTILNSPAVSVNIVESVIKLGNQMIHPFDTYERGNWKGNPKILKTIMKLTPGVKQYYKLRDIEDSLAFFNN